MTQTLYNLRTSDHGYRVTKFTDGEVESSYLTSDQACDCPAGHRATCRHRQMLPQMLARHLADSDLFWDFDRGFSCDINGNAKRETMACAPAEQDTVTIASMVELSPNADVAAEFAKLLHPPVPAGQHTAAEGFTDIQWNAALTGTPTSEPTQTVRTSSAWRRL